MVFVDIDRRKYVVIEKIAITDFKNIVKEEYSVTSERILSMIDYYIEGSSIEEIIRDNERRAKYKKEVRSLESAVKNLEKVNLQDPLTEEEMNEIIQVDKDN